MKLLISGGAGYIGSHMVRYVQERGHEVVVLDDFSTGHDWSIKDVEVLRVNLLDKSKLASILKGRYFDGVVHFAAKTLVGESIEKPDFYYKNNVTGTLNLVGEMLRNGVHNLVFSSTAAIFGNPISDKICEDHPKNPINPYGQSKLMVENILRFICSSYDFNVTCFRYFNAAGAHLSGSIGEDHNPETHLIPNILKSALSIKDKLKIFGDNYPTHDGTCIRDYVHVSDLAQAHLLGIEQMQEKRGFHACNLGNGDGFSVLEVLKSCEQVIGGSIRYQIDEPRLGDPSTLVADSSKAINELGWQPVHNQLNSIIKSAWIWHKEK